MNELFNWDKQMYIFQMNTITIIFNNKLALYSFFFFAQ